VTGTDGTRLELTWPNKDKFLLSPKDETGKPVWVDRSHPAASEVRLVDFTESCGTVDPSDPVRDNLLFTGDSLDVLRILAEHPEYRREYCGRVKCVYIDPPFNTGQAFAHYDDWMEHSTWLSFMRDRLLLIRDLLAPDGSVWVHLDDVEQHRMRCLMDEVFGSQNFITSVVWQKLYARKSNTRVSTSHDTIVCYARDERKFTVNLLPPTPELLSRYKNPDSDPRGPWQSISFHVRTDNPERRVDYRYEVTLPSGRSVAPPAGRHWNGKRERYERLLREGMLWFGSAGDAIPRMKMFLKLEDIGLTPNTWWDRTEVGDNEESKSEVQKLFPGVLDVFQTPKPERLLQRVIHVATDPGDIVLDCFGGSGTTAAVAHKMGRRWVTAEILPKTVADFTCPRLQKVVGGSDTGGVSGLVGWGGGGGFRSVQVGPSMYDVSDGFVLLADWATNGRFAEGVSAQLDFDWEPMGNPFCGRRGRQRLAVFDGAVGTEEIRSLAGQLDEKESMTVVAQVVLPGAEELLASLSKGSRIRKAPRDLLADGTRRAQRRRVTTT